MILYEGKPFAKLMTMDGVMLWHHTVPLERSEHFQCWVNAELLRIACPVVTVDLLAWLERALVDLAEADGWPVTYRDKGTLMSDDTTPYTNNVRENVSNDQPAPRSDRLPGPLTWGMLKEAMDTWGVKPDERIAAIRLGPHTRQVGIRRNADEAVEVVEIQGIWTPPVGRGSRAP